MSVLTVFCPPGETGIFETTNIVNGVPTAITYAPRLWNGHHVIQMPKELFQTIMLGRNGKAWQDSNWEALEWLGQDHTMENGDAFPGIGRPPLVAPIATEAAPPVVVKLRAPTGATSYSVDGVEHAVGKDGTITVDERVAEILRSHSFITA
jgi:hypothetical protein